MSSLIDAAKRFTETENGALSYNSTGSAVLDLFSMAGAMRDAEDSEIIALVDNAWQEDPRASMAVLFYIRDIRYGQGEKRVFRLAMRHLVDAYRLSKGELFDIMRDVGSWQDIFSTFSVSEYAHYVKEHWDGYDLLMFKWLPSIGGSSNRAAEDLAKRLGLTPREYRKALSRKRAKLKLVETSLCSKDWGSVEYSKVPSIAGFRYRECFKRHDRERYQKFLEKVSEGKERMNASNVYPYQLVQSYINRDDACACGLDDDLEYRYIKKDVDPAIEAMWKSLPDYTDGTNALVMADTSGSMLWEAGGRPLAVAVSLALYFAERNKGLFHDEFMTFSESPRFHRIFEKADSLLERIRDVHRAGSMWGNTNLLAGIRLLLKAAVDNRIPENEMPKALYIVSDMEFDEADPTGSVQLRTNLDALKEEYRRSGYEMPTVVFWNVMSRHRNVPAVRSEGGVVLVSGCSPHTFMYALKNDADPYGFMESVLDTSHGYRHLGGMSYRDLGRMALLGKNF